MIMMMMMKTGELEEQDDNPKVSISRRVPLLMIYSEIYSSSLSTLLSIEMFLWF